MLDATVREIWVVTKANKSSTLEDICFKVNGHDLMLQFLGGLKGDDIIGFDKDATIARRRALHELRDAKNEK